MGPWFLRAGLGLLVGGVRAQESQVCCQPAGGWAGSCHYRLKCCSGPGAGIYKLVDRLHYICTLDSLLKFQVTSLPFSQKQHFFHALNSLDVHCSLLKSFKKAFLYSSYDWLFSHFSFQLNILCPHRGFSLNDSLLLDEFSFQQHLFEPILTQTCYSLLRNTQPIAFFIHFLYLCLFSHCQLEYVNSFILPE